LVALSQVGFAIVRITSKFLAKRQGFAAFLCIRSLNRWALENPHFPSKNKQGNRQKPIDKRQEKHGTALAIEHFAKNFNSLGCRISGIESFAKESTSWR
jgi:hypothetical protein